MTDLVTRYGELQALKLRVDSELIAVENGLRVAGFMPIKGRPRIAPTHTEAEAREAHARHQRGETDDWIDAGERQYQRDRKRLKRETRKKVA